LKSGVLISLRPRRNLIPPSYGTLGLAPEDLARHIAYDIGAAAVAEHLARAASRAGAVTRYSRLLIDPQSRRAEPDAGDAAFRRAHRAAMPPWMTRDRVAHRALLRRRITGHRGFHRRRRRRGEAPVLLAIHSFTQAWKSVRGPARGRVVGQGPEIGLRAAARS